jgi:hypothetical protein
LVLVGGHFIFIDIWTQLAMDGKQNQKQQRRGSNTGNEKVKKSKRSKKNKTRKKLSLDGTGGGENYATALISNRLNSKDTDGDTGMHGKTCKILG